jgi:ABC-2 type transport system permease protein
MRTPTFYTHCIIVNFIWPIFAYAIFKASGSEMTFSFVRQNYISDYSIQLFFIVFIVGISAFITSLNSISSNAISREGKHFHFMKSIPVEYKTQIFVKTLVGIVFSILGIMVFFIPSCLIMKIPFLHVIAYIILSILAITFVAYMGIYIDSLQPKLVWDDELSVLRENYNMFFSMAIVIVFVIIFSIGGYYFLKEKEISFIALFGLYTILLTICNGFIYIMSKKSLIKNIITQEEM